MTTVDNDATQAGDGEQTQQQQDLQKSGLEALNEGLAEIGGDGTSTDDAAAGGHDDGGAPDDDAGGAGEKNPPPPGDGEGEEAPTTGDASRGAARREGDQGADGAARRRSQAPTEDPINDPIPDDVKGKTRARMETLVKTAKELDEQLTALREQRDELVGTIVETGATPEQFNRALETLKLLNSSNVEERKRGLSMLREDVQTIASALGEDVGDPKLLDRHPDLREAVEEGEMTVKHARELALRREADARQREQQEQHQQLTAKQRAEIEQARRELDELEQELRSTDPDYARKRAILAPKLKEQFIRERVPPSQWARRFAVEYAKVRLQAAGGAAGKGGEPAGDPLRARQPAGSSGARRQPKSGLEALEFGLAELDGRDPAT